MKHTLIYPAGTTEGCRFAGSALQRLGFPVTDHPTPEITHLLLDIPSFRTDGTLRDGEDLSHLLRMLPDSITVIGGNLEHPLLKHRKTCDLLKDPYYLSANASITADCALRIAAPLLKTSFQDTPVLILGWGRIGKCLAQLLKGYGCCVTVAARKASDRAMLQALGYEAVDFDVLPKLLHRFRLLFNTVPSPILDAEAACLCRNCIKIELASTIGMDAPDIVPARGLPGKLAPESSGQLIANTVYRLWKEERKCM